VFEGLLGTDVAEAWGRLDVSRQRAVIDAMMTVTLNPSGRGARNIKVENIVGVDPK
jgi:hypothetical protein